MSDTGEVTKKGRTLVLCFDGTSNEYDADNTNVVKFFALLKKDDFNEQLCYYQAGVGTWFNPGVVSPLFQWGAKILDLAFAWYLDAHVMDGYKFLMQNYRVGDKICLFGFSRGAYTARALAGALYKVGLLPRDNEAQIPFAYKLYKREDKDGIELCAGFKQTYCQDVNIEFLGVWDTVASVGVIMGRTLPFVNSNTSIRTFRHALSLDEHRARFRPNNYHRPAPTKKAAKHDPERASHVEETNVPSSPLSEIKRSFSSSSSSSDHSGDDSGLGSSSGEGSPDRDKKRKKGKHFLPFRIRPNYKRYAGYASEGPLDDVLEVWFAGCHTDIGGGAVPNSTPNSLANISLRWMVREAVKSGCAIQFDPEALKRAQIDVEGLRSDKEAETPQSSLALDAVDALQPVHDELKSNILWWILELVPSSFTWQDEKGVWHRSFGWHLGRGRKIHESNPMFHSSVKRRTESDLKYTPRARWEKGRESYVS